jgi:glycosyltransferase involved in cell wall biosynthesis
MKVRVVPHVDDLKTGESGIHTVVRKWFAHGKKFGIDFVDKHDDNFDVLAVHAGMGSKYPHGTPCAVHLHGIYWTADLPMLAQEWKANLAVIDSIRHADQITVPSNWVAESIQRDVRVNPTVIPHGVDWDEWQHTLPNDGYILAYAKNRIRDVCNPAYVNELARQFPDKLFLCTFALSDAPPNVRITGLLPHDKMKQVIQRAAVTISAIKETAGILTLESLASGTPVLGYAYGGNNDLIQHGVSGYLAQPGNIDSLAEGLRYCLQYRDTLGKNANKLAKEFTWDKSCEKLVEVYKLAMRPKNNSVSVIIPCYNYAHLVDKAIESVLNQTRPVKEIIIVDDGSTDNTKQVVSTFSKVKYCYQENAGVAVARNTGIAMATGEYIVCLDADDRIDIEWVRACWEALEADPLLGIAYTGLLAVEPDGKQTISQWPPQYNFDDMVYPGGINQIPTCCMFRKEMWKRLGGYRSRYAPKGAGSEDAEFWLRSGLYGFKGKKVTDAPLFIYSYKSGRVSGDKAYKEINWRELHPSTRDQLHPFLCVATPMNGRMTHPVRQYDNPIVSIIIPVGPGHKPHAINALDSIESQTLRKWEAILVDDTGEEDGWTYDGVPDILTAYPYVKLIKTSGKKGAGYARNRGVEKARAGLITFLDADDNFLVPEALDNMVAGWNETGMGVYTDYISKAFITKEEAERLQNSKRLLDYNPQDGLAMHLSYAGDYDCERACIQPANPLYIWNLITTLIPKAWHDEIGGFDENMPSWEDWEYWIRMARTGKCFARLPKPMVAYRFYTGGRRETGIQMPQELLNYITKKLEGVETMPCRSCGGNKKQVTVAIPLKVQQESKLTDDDMVLITYENPNRGMHGVYGAATKINYGYRAGGGMERFYVHKADIATHPGWFIPVLESSPNIAQSVSPPVEVSPPKELDFIKTNPASELNGLAPQSVDILKIPDLQSLPGITDKIADILFKKGVKTWNDIIELGIEGLQTIEGIGPKRAVIIFDSAKKSAGM